MKNFKFKIKILKKKSKKLKNPQQEFSWLQATLLDARTGLPLLEALNIL